ncbi:putative DNA repair protein (Rad57) [Aspergillus stella-maris]|uniref:putative DNA repair protein (Rad57) n=1 Tax=Aspergillus stella-maris TaxID=1810926 RepID=UPI003CCE46AE
MDLLSILPNFPTRPYSHILPPLERSRINTVDLISLDTLEIAKRAHVPLSDVRRLAQQVIKALHNDVGFEEALLPEQENGQEQDRPDSSLDIERPLIAGLRTKLDLSEWCTISTLDHTLDDLLNGGVATGYVMEVTGESGCGKTQFLLGLLLAVQLPKPRGAGKSAIYISTEAPLATNRLSQLIESHPELASLSRDEKPSLGKILSINAMDLESQDHILNYQLPVAIRRYDVGLVVIDSITSNYRAEHTSHDLSGLSTRSGELAKLGQMLRNLAAREDIAIVVANQVSDRFEGEDRLDFRRLTGDRTPVSSQQAREFHLTDREAAASPLARLRPPESGNAELNQTLAILQSTPNFPSSSPMPTQEEPAFDGSYLVGNPVRNEILSLQRQQRFFTGWGDIAQPWTQNVYRPSLKTPTLGLVWATQVACRIALKKYIRPVSLDPLQFGNATYSTLVQIPREEGEASEFKVPATAPIRSDGDQAHPDDLTAAAGRVPTSSEPSPFQPPEQPIQRTMKLVFSPWAGGPTPDVPGSEFQDEVEFEIWKGGIRAVKRFEGESKQ